MMPSASHRFAYQAAGSTCGAPSPSLPGFRRTSGSSAAVACLAASATTQGGGAVHVDPKELHVLLLRQRVSNMFRRYVPTKLHRLDIALLRYHGKEEALLRSLVAKFGPEPAFSSEQQQLSDALSDSIAHATAIAERRRRHPGATGTAQGMRSHSPPVQPPHPDIGRQRCRHLDCDDGPQPMEGSSGSGHGLCPDASGYSAVRRCRTTSPRPEQFPAAVALVAHHHQLRSRLFEAYAAKRSIVRMQEEKERESLARLVAFEFRHIMSQLSRRQTEALLLAQREKTVMVEGMLAQRRQEEARAAWLQTQSTQLLLKAQSRREDEITAERAERRVLARHYADERVRLFRHERRLSKLRDVAEEEARRAMLFGDVDSGGGRSTNDTPITHRQRLEEAMMMGESSVVSLLVANHSNARRPSLQATRPDANAAHNRTPAEFSLFSDLGTTVAYSLGGPPSASTIASSERSHVVADFPTLTKSLQRPAVEAVRAPPRVMVEVPMLPCIRKSSKRRAARGKSGAVVHHDSQREGE